MIGIGFELGSNKHTPFGLRPALLTQEGRAHFWDKLRNYAVAGDIDSVTFHRFYGEHTRGDYFDYDSRTQIEESGDTVLTDYAKHMTAELARFAREFPDLRIDLYLGSLRQFRMMLIARAGQIAEWLDRFFYEIEIPRQLIADGGNIRMVFDHSSTYAPDSIEWQAVRQLSRIHPERVVVEAIPKEGQPQRSLSAWAFEDQYQRTLARDPERAMHIGLTRMTKGDPEGGVVEFVKNCAQLGHDCVVSDMVLARSEMTMKEVRREADAGRPQGTE